MLHHYLPLALLAFLPLTSAQCAACDSYSAALTSCQATRANVTAIGGTMDVPTIHCMCVSSSSAADINTCLGCYDTGSSTDTPPDIEILSAWETTCKADENFGDQQAVACWEGQPSDFLPCVSNTGASGGVGKGTTTGLSSVTMSATSAANGHSATGTPSTTVKSDAVVSFQAFEMLSVMIVGLGMVIRV